MIYLTSTYERLQISSSFRPWLANNLVRTSALFLARCTFVERSPPLLPDRAVGHVTRLGADHIALLVHGAFNASITRQVTLR